MFTILVLGALMVLTVAAASRWRVALPASVILTAAAVAFVPVAWASGYPLLAMGLSPVAVISAVLLVSHVRAARQARAPEQAEPTPTAYPPVTAYLPVTRFRDDLTGYTITLETLNRDEAGIVERLDGRYLRVVSVVPSVDHGFNRRAASATAQKLGAVFVDKSGRSTVARRDAAALHRPEPVMVGGPDPDEPEIDYECGRCMEPWPCPVAVAEGVDRVPAVVLNGDGPATDESPF